jgi:hypothetical protein
MRRPVQLTSDATKFVGTLRPGDLLLFDGVSPISELIKLAENRPVNHCGIYLGKREFAEVRGHKPAKDAKAPPLVPAARASNLEVLLHSSPRYERTVTALRHVNASARGAPPVAQRAREYADAADTTYRYLSLIALMVPSFFRSYENYLIARRRAQLLADVLRIVSQSILDVSEAEGDKPSNRDRRRTFTCSEFVYRCFSEAGTDTDYSIEVARPLGRWVDGGGHEALAEAVERADARRLARRSHDPSMAVRGGGRRQTGRPQTGRTPRVGAKGRTAVQSRRSKTVDGEGLVRFDPSLKTGLVSPGQVGAAQARAWGIKKDLAVLAGETLLDILKHNIRRDKYKDVARGPGHVVPEFVTPRDFWSTRSLAAVSVLHLPPAYETDLDAPHADERDG